MSVIPSGTITPVMLSKKFVYLAVSVTRILLASTAFKLFTIFKFLRIINEYLNILLNL